MAEFSEEQLNKIERAADLITRSLDESMRADDEINLAATSGTNDLKFEQVKPGRVLMLEVLYGADDTNAPTRTRVGYWNGHRYNWFLTQPAPLTTETVLFSGRVRLREGMYPIVRFEGCTLNDDLYAALNGYWVKI